MVIKVLTGNYTVAEAVRLSNVDLITAYPITPQTTIVERLSELVEGGLIKARLVRVESEFSALAAAYGAASCGARAFTATSSHGLLFMHEMLWWVAGSRVPMVLAVVTRALGPPWNIWNEHTDFMGQRDCGWLMAFAENNQEILDTIIQLYRITEDEAVYLPGILGLDGFLLSHASEPVDIPDEDVLKDFIKPRSQPYNMCSDDVLTMGNLPMAEEAMMMRYDIHKSIEAAKNVINEVDEEYRKLTGRSYGGLAECYRCNDSKYLIIAMGGWVGTMKDVCDELRDEGYDVGVLKIRFFRPFPHEDLVRAISGVKGILVFDRSASLGSLGHIHAEVLARAYMLSNKVIVKGVITGLGGVDVGPKEVREIFMRFVKDVDEDGQIDNISEWVLGGG
ncbi:MAG: transketolase C-terminal domain-containing protein [Sulfolobales archaeon]|nr:pyruvate ferredoxin oxidoreductase [Sulfolobales archaeon]MCX8185623.1 pyruvate ferredoxin oxidoreductase [Sulfolobales archaeon]MDW7969566.1 transketolase C-terminal domain-containing protein [Sulfolobales archaeon]